MQVEEEVLETVEVQHQQEQEEQVVVEQELIILLQQYQEQLIQEVEVEDLHLHQLLKELVEQEVQESLLLEPQQVQECQQVQAQIQ